MIIQTQSGDERRRRGVHACRSTTCAGARDARGHPRRARLRELTSDDQIGKVTLVGAGMKSQPGIAAKMFRVLAEQGINLQMIDTSTIRISS